MPELAYLAAVQRAPGGVAEHRTAGEFRTHVGWMAPEVPERAVLRLPAAGHRAAQPDQASLRRVPPGALRRPLAARPHGEPPGDVQDGEWRALRVSEQDLVRVRRDSLGWHVERDRGGPWRPVGENATLRDRGPARSGHEPR